MMPLGTPTQVHALRGRLWDAGFRPVPIYNPDAAHASPGKAPMGEDWGNAARATPPAAVVAPADPAALNTGILCDGLRAIDVDIDNPTIAASVKAKALDMFGEAPMRYRQNSARVLLLYRAAEGAPPKRSVAGNFGKVEVLGRGQQFVAHGVHPSGADLHWMPEAPGDTDLDSLTPLTEDQITAFLTAVAPSVGAKAPTAPTTNTAPSPRGLGADPLQVIAALSAIPNDQPKDWEHWNRIGMATWAATGGGEAGRAAFHAWSQQHAAYDPAETNARWDHYASSPPTQIGAGTLFYLARGVRREMDDAPPADEDAYGAGLEEIDEPEVAPRPETAPKQATDLLWCITDPWNEADIPTRPWIAKGYLMRRSISVLSGPGSAGKSSLMVAWSVALTTGRAFHGLRCDAPMRVATYNVEDDADEQRRRFSATLQRFELTHADLGERLAILGPSGIGTLLQTAREGSVLVNTQVMDRLEAFVSTFLPDVLILDPFVELHAAEENDNTAVRAVMARFRTMAIEHNMAVILLHHARKGAGEPGDPDSMRGASSIVGAARVALTMNVMTKEEAEAFSIAADKRRDYFRLDGAKNNYAPIESAEWFGREEMRLANGDGVAVAWPWRPPSIFRDLEPQRVHAVLDRIAAGYAPGVLYRPSQRGGASPRWVGNVLVNEGLNEEQAKRIVTTWLSSGLLYETTYKDTTEGKIRPGVLVDDSKRPSI